MSVEVGEVGGHWGYLGGRIDGKVRVTLCGTVRGGWQRLLGGL